MADNRFPQPRYTPPAARVTPGYDPSAGGSAPSFGTGDWRLYQNYLQNNPTDANMEELYGPEDSMQFDMLGRPVPMQSPRYRPQSMNGENRLMQLAQAGGSPYDEDAYMRFPVARRGGQQQPQYDGGGGSDMDMMMMYGPEDQVAYDPQGRPIPLADPRHPRNQRAAPQINAVPPFMPPPIDGYPQRRR